MLQKGGLLGSELFSLSKRYITFHIRDSSKIEGCELRNCTPLYGNYLDSTSPSPTTVSVDDEFQLERGTANPPNNEQLTSIIKVASCRKKLEFLKSRRLTAHHKKST